MELPAQFGKYELLDRLATGGMAELYLARAFGVEGFEKRLVIKRILPALASSDRFVGLFIQEAKICARLTHPNVVNVFDLGRVNDDHYIAMEHIHGRDLTRTVRKLRANGEKLPLRFAVYIVACMARGLAYAHSRKTADGENLGIVHRDISPHNVMLSFEGEVKILDFGIARVEGTESGSVEGKPGGGKFAYMSPEQAKGQAVDHRTDIFACGIVLYELLVNHRLFQHPDLEEKLRRVVEAEVPDVREEAPEVSERLWTILQKSLAREPADRYQEASEFEEDLRAMLFAEGFRADDALLGQFLRGLFADEVVNDSAATQMGDLLRGLWMDDSRTVSDAGSGTSLESIEVLTGGTPHHVAERKQVSTLCLELIGLTQAWGELEPERVLKKHNQLFRIVEKVVERYGGWIESHSDEGFSILFGVPKTREDDLDRAVNCSRHLLRTMERLQKEGSSLSFAMGIHGGEVVWIEESASWRCLARGDAIKLAKRLAAAAGPGEIRVSEWVSSRADGWRFEQEQPLPKRGRKGSHLVWSLAGRWMKERGHGPGRWETRSGEIELLMEALEGLARGQGGLLSVYGEAGSGKSRLIRELELLALKSGLPFFGGRSLPYGVAPPLAVIRDIVAAFLGISNRDGPDVIRERLGHLEQIQLTSAEIATLSALFAIEIGKTHAPTKADVYKAGLSFVRGVARDRSVLFVLEDIHHLTAVEQELLAHLLQNQGSIPLLWIVTHRGPWLESLPKPDTQIHLGPLAKGHQSHMIAERFGAKQVAPELLELVTSAAEGNPLYVMEILKALERQQGVETVDGVVQLVSADAPPQLPASLEALVSSRVDALDSDAKMALQVASVIAPTFRVELLQLCVPQIDLSSVLQILVQRGLLIRENEDRCAFATQLIWEVVRGSILGSQLREQHQRVSEGIEQLYEGHLESQYEVLSDHCSSGGRLMDAARYAELAGDRHRLMGLIERSAACYQHGIDVLEKVVDDSSEDLRLEGLATLYLKLGRMTALMGMQDKAAKHLQVAQEISADILVPELEIGCIVELGKLYVQQGKMSLARVLLEQGLSEARVAGLQRPLVDLHISMGHMALEEGQAKEAKEHFVAALEVAAGQNDLAASAFSGLANVHNRLGELDLAMAALGQARVLAEESGDALLQSRIVNNMGTTFFANGDYMAALASFREALEVNRGAGYRRGVVYNLHNIGDVLFRQEEFARAYTAFEQARQIAKEYGLRREVAFNEVFLGYLLAQRGEWEEGLELLERGIEIAGKHSDVESVLMGRWLEGKLMSQAGRSSEGRTILEGALGQAKTTEIAWLVRDIELELEQL